MCAELAEYVSLLDEPPHGLVIRARALLDQPEPVAPTDEELIGPIMWMLDDYVYDNDKGEIAQSLRRLITRWGTPANNTSQEN
jgi:hypothetical protein